MGSKIRRCREDIHDLDRLIGGDVCTDILTKYMLATDGSIFQKAPAGVVYPKTPKDVAITVQFADRLGLSVHPRGSR